MRTRALLVVPVVALLFAACAADTSAEPEPNTATSAVPDADPVATTTTLVAPPTTAPDMAPTTTQGVETPATSTTSLPGGPIDFGPRSGDVLAVVGVAHDDTLNLRAAPGPTQDILDTISPLFVGLVAAGETWERPGAFWVKVDYEDTLGWVHMGFVAYSGGTDDVTAQAIAALGEIPVATTMEELGLLVADTFTTEEPPSKVVMVAAPTLGDFGELAYDVIGIGDDAVRGVRLHVFGAPVAEGFSLKSIEATDLCARGVSFDGFCI